MRSDIETDLKPLVSIVTISFNSVKTLEKTIQSVLNQTYKNIEYIIIDGGSVDGTTDLISKYKDKLKYWISEKDSGISNAFNKGILKSTGEIVGILNSDDWFEEDTIEKVVASYKLENFDLLVGSLRYWEIDGRNFIVLPDQNYEKRITYRMPLLHHPATFVKREVYESIGIFDESLKVAMDYEFFLRSFLKKKKIVLSNYVFTNMAYGGTSFKKSKQGYNEVLSKSIDRKRAILWFYYSILKDFLHSTFLKFKLYKLLYYSRKIKYKIEDLF